MTFATVVEFIVSHKKLIGISLILLVVGIYIGTLKLELKHDNNKIGQQNAQLAEKDQEIANLKAGIVVQNQAINQMAKYAEDKDRRIADATALAEKLQDTIDAQANEIMLRKTNIDMQITTLADCQNELGRIKAYMVGAEAVIKERQK